MPQVPIPGGNGPIDASKCSCGLPRPGWRSPPGRATFVKGLPRLRDIIEAAGDRPLAEPLSGGGTSLAPPALVPCVPRDWQIPPPANADDQFLNLIVLSPAGRSGSTLLQRICNARKGTLIWGEQGGALWHFAELYRAIVETADLGQENRDKFFGHDDKDPNQWIACVNPDLEFARHAVVASARALLNTFYGQYRQSHDLVGFKEIRYGRVEIELLRRCYPQADLLLLIRHPCDTWGSTSRDWPYSLEEWIALWQANTECYLRLRGATRVAT